MEDSFRNKNKEEIYSKAVRAGKRTYFFDVKETRNQEQYLTITESKRRFSEVSGKFFYEKHKIFLYGEDFEKFTNGLNDVMKFVETGVTSYLNSGEIQEYDQVSDVVPDNFEEYESSEEGKS